MLKHVKIPVEEDKKDFLKIYKDSFININKPMKKQPVCLSYGTKFNDYVPIVSYGNFMCLVGASKSMKTWLKSALNAGYIGGNANQYFNELKGHNTTDRHIVDFDTEQGNYHVQRAARRVGKMVGANYPYYKPFALRRYTPKERLEFIEWVFYESEFKSNIGLGSIDGIADLVTNVNDLDESNRVTQKLMKITEDKNCGMILVIHKNFESLKPTGHLGSAIVKKAETVLYVEKKNDIANVKAKYSRNIPIDEFSFTINSEQLPQVIDDIVF